MNSAMATAASTNIVLHLIAIANELGNGKVANMVMLGAYIAATGALKADTLREMIRQMFTGPKAKLVDLNMTALARGMECV